MGDLVTQKRKKDNSCDGFEEEDNGGSYTEKQMDPGVHGFYDQETTMNDNFREREESAFVLITPMMHLPLSPMMYQLFKHCHLKQQYWRLIR